MKPGLGEFLREAAHTPIRTLAELVEYNRLHWSEALQKGRWWDHRQGREQARFSGLTAKIDDLQYPQGQEFLERCLAQNMTEEEYRHILQKLLTLAGSDGIDYALKTHGVDVLVVPGWSWLSIYASVAGKRGEMVSCNLSAIAYNTFPVGTPVGTVPLGTYPNGRPYGISLIARKGQDARILELMLLFEKSFPRRRTPASMRSMLFNIYYRVTS
jgi:Asp-tRNA(Asn)/Glu-tRNA(Gln) amidotransferase A subunit family amidase